MLIDSHAHLDAEGFQSDLPEVLKRASEAGVKKIIAIGSGSGGFLSAINAVALSKTYPGVFPTVGVHPSDSKTPLDPAYLEKLASDRSVVAIGETGIDLYWKEISLEEQIPWFEAQIEIAQRLKKPLIIHARASTNECLQTLKKYHAEDIGGVFHCYTDSPDFIQEILDINFHLSFTGIVTFKKSLDVQESARRVPLDRLLVETDAPFLAPEPFRGKRCESAQVVHTAKRIAEIKGVSFEELCEKTTANAERLFSL
jgi:TatD DNase family protein